MTATTEAQIRITLSFYNDDDSKELFEVWVGTEYIGCLFREDDGWYAQTPRATRTITPMATAKAAAQLLYNLR